MWKIEEYYTYYLDTMDPRVTDWPLMSSFGYPVSIIGFYLLGFYFFIPEIMKHRRPLDIIPMLNIYNPVLVTVNLILAYLLSWNIYKANYAIGCQRVDYNGGEIEDKIATLIWYFHLIKIFEFGDTLIMGFQKKPLLDPSSILHIYHHTTMVLASWIAAKMAPGGTTAYFALVNSLVHFIMYMYYKLKDSGFIYGPALKIVVILVQMTQFSLVALLSLISISCQCKYPNWLAISTFCYASVFMIWIVPGFIYSFPRRNLMID